jgi:hypothetical protein
MVMLHGCPTPTPTPHPSASQSVSSAKNKFGDISPATLSRKYLGIFSRENQFGPTEREILVFKVYGKYFERPRNMVSRQLLIVQITTAGFTPPSPQPWQAWHGYRAINAHHEEVG